MKYYAVLMNGFQGYIPNLKQLFNQQIGIAKIIAAAILFIAGNPYITGSNLITDGGKSLV